MGKPKPLPDNTDGKWRSYFGLRLFHHYGLVYAGQTADCGASTNTLCGNFSPLRPERDKSWMVCGRCRKIVEAKAQEKKT
jgi:hypothetical protein